MQIFFYFMLVAFAANDVYLLLNRRRLSSNFRRRDAGSVGRLDLLHYLLRLAAAFWPFLGLFTPFWVAFAILVGAWFVKFLMYHLSERAYAVYSLALPLVSAAVWSAVFLLWVTG